MTADNYARTPPAALPAPPKGYQKTKTELIQLFPEVKPDSTMEISPEIFDTYTYAKWAARYWETQAQNAVIEMRRQMGNAEAGTINGVPVIKRYQGEVSGHFVEGGHRDYLQGLTR